MYIMQGNEEEQNYAEPWGTYLNIFCGNINYTKISLWGGTGAYLYMVNGSIHTRDNTFESNGYQM